MPNQHYVNLKSTIWYQQLHLKFDVKSLLINLIIYISNVHQTSIFHVSSALKIIFLNSIILKMETIKISFLICCILYIFDFANKFQNILLGVPDENIFKLEEPFTVHVKIFDSKTGALVRSI
jgi:hypothetical protein